MIRRDFIKTSAFLASAVSIPSTIARDLDKTGTSCRFRRYRSGNSLCPVYRITPDDGYYLHTFYDICPWSPSQRFLACTKFPFQDREPNHREAADICVIDLQEETIRSVYSTTGWGFQLGANIQWGKTDRHLYFNDKVDEEPVCIRLDFETGKSDVLAGPLYHIAPDESCIISFPSDLLNATQAGYGVAVAPDRQRQLAPGAAADEGIWRTDLRTNRKTLLISLAEAYEILPESDKRKFEGGTCHFFHSKFSPRGDRILQVFRCLLPESSEEFGVGGTKRVNPSLLTFNPDGSDLKLAVSNDVWGKGGHHPNWHPDSDHILMNLTLGHDELRLCRFRPDGSEFTVLSESVYGSGHPSYHKNGRHIITDCYPEEVFAARTGEVPIRLIDLEDQTEKNICFIFTGGLPNASVLRIDPHVVWSRDCTQVCFNGASEGRRQLYIADLSELLET